MKFFPFMILMLCCFIMSCNEDFEPNEKVKNLGLFQASDYILKDYKETRATRKLFKVIKINETIDSLTVSDTVTPGEIVLLNKLNLDNPKWKDKYIADTTFGVYGDPDKLSYTTDDSKLPVRLVEVFMNEGKVGSIRVHSQRSSLINHHDQILTYYPTVGYELISTQKMWSGDTIRMNVKARFIDK